jgi:hypothetical protein
MIGFKNGVWDDAFAARGEREEVAFSCSVESSER